jgi:hypothetical protein
MLLAQRHQYPGGPVLEQLVDLAANGTPDPTPSATGTEDWGFSALYPDGSKLLTAAQPAAAVGLPPRPLNRNNGQNLQARDQHTQFPYDHQPSGDGRVLLGLFHPAAVLHAASSTMITPGLGDSSIASLGYRELSYRLRPFIDGG